MTNCPNCGMYVEHFKTACPKCDTAIYKPRTQKPLVIDIAHNGEDWEHAREKIEEALNEAFLFGAAGLQVIHGRGGRAGHSNMIARKSIPYLKDIAARHGSLLMSHADNPGAHTILFHATAG